MSHRYVLVGGGMAADAAAKAIRAADPQGAVTLVTAEPDAPYRRPHLSKALWSGGAEAKAFLGTAGHGVEVMTGRAVTGIDTRAHRVTLEDGQALEYDQLLIAAGARARRLPGLPEEGPVVAYRSFADYRLARSRAGEGRRTLVVGGGFVGAELAAGLAAAGTAVHMAFPETGLGAGRFPAGLAEALTERYRARGVDVQGPIPGDTVFVRAARGEFDCVLAAYHDQGLIPVKLLAFGSAVNVTLGLPIVRTSVDHGTAFDIAGQGKADAGSMIEAVRLAARLARGDSE